MPKYLFSMVDVSGNKWFWTGSQWTRRREQSQQLFEETAKVCIKAFQKLFPSAVSELVGTVDR